MQKDKASEGLAAYVGISAPETPKYLLTNNFLLDYFQQTGENGKRYDFETFAKNGVLYTEDDQNREKLKESFNVFLKRYLGTQVIQEENKKINTKTKHYYFPMTQDMLTESAPTLRHLLFHLQNYDKKFDFTAMREKLAVYVFGGNAGLSQILKILFQEQDGKVKYAERMSYDATNTFWGKLNDSEQTRMRNLGRQLNTDLDTLLTHKYFCKLDFYRRYHYLSVLLTSYVIQYIVRRKSNSAFLLCKGGIQDVRLEGNIHRACYNNYAGIRSLFPDLMQTYYCDAVRKEMGEEEKIKICTEAGRAYIKEREFNEFAVEVMGRKQRSDNELEFGEIVKAFHLQEGEDKVTVEEFVLRYINLTKSRTGSTLNKMSSVLPTSGKQIGMVYPDNNARQKYFAMSGSLAEFYVRLYLAIKERKYDYLDNFLEFLYDRYRIVIVKSKENERAVKSVKPKLSAFDYSKNKAVFIDTLNNANCLIKLSDSGYVVTLPEEKGGLKLV